MSPIDPNSLIQRCRKVTGISAILLPFTETGEIDWKSFDHHVKRTVDAGLTPAVNMDTGYVNLIDQPTRDQVLGRTNDLLGGGQFVAGAFVSDREGDTFQRDVYRKQMAAIQERGGMPIVFQSYGLTRQPGPEIIASYQQLAEA